MNRLHVGAPRHLRRLVVVLAVATLALAGCADVKPKQSADRLPDVTLKSLTGGRSLDLGTLKGPAVVNLWATYCAPCKAELPRYAAFAKRSGSAVKVIGVDWQETYPPKARAMLRRAGATYPVVTDPDGDIRTGVLPRLLLVDAHGTVVYNQALEIKSVAQLSKLVSEHLGVDGPAA